MHATQTPCTHPFFICSMVNIIFNTSALFQNAVLSLKTQHHSSVTFSDWDWKWKKRKKNYRISRDWEENPDILQSKHTGERGKIWRGQSSPFQVQYSWDLFRYTHGKGNLIVFFTRAFEPSPSPTPSWLMQKQHSHGSPSSLHFFLLSAKTNLHCNFHYSSHALY